MTGLREPFRIENTAPPGALLRHYFSTAYSVQAPATGGAGVPPPPLLI